MVKFLKSGDTFRVASEASLNLHERLPTATYKVGFNCGTGQFFLERIDDFEIKGKIYGDTNQVADRILTTFRDRELSTGVLLAGEKGSGKTLLAKRVSMLAASNDDIPTIVINQDWSGEAFNGFLQSIQQPAIVVFDEFEKVYSDASKQEALLTLLDGVYPSKKLYMFTCNNKWKLNTNMRNRPGRIFYMLDYHGLDEKFIREYCEDNLKNKSHINMVCLTSRIFRAFNFDMLKAIVEEMNRYNETPAQALKFLNTRADFEEKGLYRVKLTVDGQKRQTTRPMAWHGNPLVAAVSIRFQTNTEGWDSPGTAIFTPEHLQRADLATGSYIFLNKKNQRLTLIPNTSGHTSVDFEAIQRLPIIHHGDDDTMATPPSTTDSESSQSS